MNPEIDGDKDFKIDLPSSPKHAEDWKEGKDFKIPTLYDMLVGNQRSADWWHNREYLERLRQGAFALSVMLDIRVNGQPAEDEERRRQADFGRQWQRPEIGNALGIPLIRVEKLNIKTVGCYHPEADGYALVGTIAFNEARLADMQPAAVMAYLLKFLLCAWRHQSGGKGEFDRECREKMSSYGLIIDAKGNITIDPEGQFARLLGSVGIENPVEPAAPPPREGKATSKVWSCRCQRARVGTKVFFANCPNCGQTFELGDHVGVYPEGTSVTDTTLAERRED